eukprot:TRINITY_DN3545_c0_g1_i1.p1 TRINITY_DN3545_c0_g1~~TRINITY_DN3545_c0_g1_i1.p1  ORF type:complete len:315 (-),score=71.00 TRINITY_DN3545_c0_g1_i1:52-996(-)
MENPQQYKSKREKVKEEAYSPSASSKEEEKGPSTTKQQRPSTTTSLPPSSSSSPSHEFSFTLSLHPTATAATLDDNKRKPPPPSFAIDLSPADDIFFHGHLLPLQLLSNLPTSPRSPTTSFENLNLSVRDPLDNPNQNHITITATTTNKTTNNSGTKETSKTNKSFSLFGMAKWRKPLDIGEEREDGEKQKVKKEKKVRFDVSQILKRYARVVRPLLFFRGRKEKREFRRQPYSFSGNLNVKGKEEVSHLRGRRGEYSAPASMRTSPTNSGLLFATATFSSGNDSTMEELQNAIQAAIAHCKNSIAIKEDKFNC